MISFLEEGALRSVTGCVTVSVGLVVEGVLTVDGTVVEGGT